MKKSISKSKRGLIVTYCKVAVTILFLSIISCSDNEELETELTETSSELNDATSILERVNPVIGKRYTIQNRRSNRTLDISNQSNNNGANLQLWGTDVNTGATNRQWDIINLGNGYVRLKGVDSKKTLEVSGGNNSDRANVQQWTYQGTTHQQWQILATNNGYFRLKNRDSGKSLWAAGTNNGSNVAQYAYRGWLSQQWAFTEVGGGGNDDDDDDNGGGGGSPANNLGGLKNWKLNGYNGSASNNNYVDNVPNLANYSNSNWFYTNGTRTIFKTYSGSDTSSGSGNPRTELRELTSNGSSEINWNGTDSSVDRMVWKVRVSRLPSSGKIAFGQIHAKSGSSFDDVLRVQAQGSANQTSGPVRLRILGWVTENSNSGTDNNTETGFGFNLNTDITLELKMVNKRVTLNLLNPNGSFNRELFHHPNVNSSGNYFKVGCYLQSMSGKSYSSSDYGMVAISSLKVFH